SEVFKSGVCAAFLTRAAFHSFSIDAIARALNHGSTLTMKCRVARLNLRPDDAARNEDKADENGTSALAGHAGHQDIDVDRAGPAGLHGCLHRVSGQVRLQTEQEPAGYLHGSLPDPEQCVLLEDVRRPESQHRDDEAGRGGARSARPRVMTRKAAPPNPAPVPAVSPQGEPAAALAPDEQQEPKKPAAKP